MIVALNGERMPSGAVTFLDVLGWRGIWARGGQSTEASVERLRRLLTMAKTEAESQTHAANLRGVSTDVISISDTIVMQTAGTATETLNLHAKVCERLIPESIRLRLPLRGATTYGQFVPRVNPSDDTIVVGPAVDEAASWHEATDWIGVVLTPSAGFMLPHDGNQAAGWVEYEHIPFKVGRLPRMRCVDWRGHWPGDGQALREAFASMGPLVTEFAPKFLHSLRFYEEFEGRNSKS